MMDAIQVCPVDHLEAPTSTGILLRQQIQLDLDLDLQSTVAPILQDPTGTRTGGTEFQIQLARDPQLPVVPYGTASSTSTIHTSSQSLLVVLPGTNSSYRQIYWQQDPTANFCVCNTAVGTASTRSSQLPVTSQLDLLPVSIVAPTTTSRSSQHYSCRYQDPQYQLDLVCIAVRVVHGVYNILQARAHTSI